MHELSLSRAIAGIVTRAAAGRHVRAVQVDCGALRQVVPETLAACWDLVVATTPLEGARLEVNEIPARLACADCGATTTLDRLPLMVCAACGSRDVTVTTGEEFLVHSIDVDPSG
jgi:hydrogenase nickel incorporation protein HypA/HybF